MESKLTPNRKNLTFSPVKYSYVLLALTLTIGGLYYGRGFLVPIAFSVLITFILLPVVRKLESWKINTIFSIILSFLMVILVLFGVSFFFGSQISNLVTDFNEFSSKFGSLLKRGVEKYNQSFDFLPPLSESEIQSKLQELASNKGGTFLGTTVIETSSFLATAFLVPVYVFLFLLYRKGIKMAILLFFRKSKRDEVCNVMNEVQTVGKDYLFGLFTVMFILAICNSLSLYIIGIDYPIMFGCLAALLIVIPYIGTYLGALLPILYALITMDAQSAFFILVAFVVIQAIEGNFLTPKIVGSNTSVNPLAAFVALILGGSIWGIAGMILSIPFTAMLKKIFKHVVGLQPLAALLGEEIYEEDVESEDEIEEDFNNPIPRKPKKLKKRNILIRLVKIWTSSGKTKIEEEAVNLEKAEKIIISDTKPEIRIVKDSKEDEIIN